MAWIVPPENQGQIVEVSYASDHVGGIYRRTFNKSEGTVIIETANIADCGCENECNCFEPWNLGFNSEIYNWQPSWINKRKSNVR